MFFPLMYLSLLVQVKLINKAAQKKFHLHKTNSQSQTICVFMSELVKKGALPGILAGGKASYGRVITRAGTFTDPSQAALGGVVFTGRF